MGTITAILRWIFTYLLYPAIILGTMLALFLAIAAMVRRYDPIRCLVAAILPLAILVFIVASDASPEALGNALGAIAPGLRFVIGAMVGTVLVEMARILLQRDSEIGPAVYTLILSSTGVFIVYCIMVRAIQSVHIALLGLVVAAGLEIVLRGFPRAAAPSRAPRMPRPKHHTASD